MNPDSVVWFGTEVDRAVVPASAAQALQQLESELPIPETSFPRLTVQMALLAFEIEDSGVEGYRRREFLASTGHLLFRREDPLETDMGFPVESLEQLDPDLRRTILLFSGKFPLLHLRQERDWGLPVISASWSAGGFVHEIEIMEDGQPLFVEVQVPVPMPPGVREQLRLRAEDAGQDGLLEAETLLLFAFGSLDPKTMEIDLVVLADGHRVLAGESLPYDLR